MTAVTKRQILRSCKARGWTVQPAALEGMLSSCNNQPNYNDGDDGDDVLAQLLDRIADAINGGRTVTAELWNELAVDEEEDDNADGAPNEHQHRFLHRSSKKMGQLLVHQNCHKNKTKKQQQLAAAAAAAPSVEIVPAFETPKLVYQVMRKQFQVVQEDWPLWGSAEDKIRMLSDRYNMIHQRVLRHELFRPSGLHHHHHGGGGQHQLTPIESLLGHSTSSSAGGHRHNKLVLVLGVLLQLQEGAYCLEDPTGQVPVQLQHCTVTDHSYVTEHSVLLVEGHFRDGVLTVHRVGQPLPESRASALEAVRKQVAHPHYSTTITSSRPLPGNHHKRQQHPFRKDDSQPSFLIVADVPMDLPRVSQQWEALLTGYEHKLTSQDRRRPRENLPLFVVMGPFHSNPAVRQQRQGADDLLALVARFPGLAARGHFCLVPAVDGVSVLPWRNPPPPRGGGHSRAVPNCHFASNPCRIRWAGREMVVFRYDLLPLLQQHSMALPAAAPPSASQDDDGDDDDSSLKQEQQPHPYSRLIQTVLNQGHLVPVAGTPIYWNYNHALSLYPMPDCLVLSGGNNRGECHTERYYDCRVVIPGSMAQRGTYALYQPDCETDSDGDDDSSSSDEEMRDSSSAAVKFGTLLAGED